jgi:hypothetical protein
MNVGELIEFLRDFDPSMEVGAAIFYYAENGSLVRRAEVTDLDSAGVNGNMIQLNIHSDMEITGRLLWQVHETISTESNKILEFRR